MQRKKKGNIIWRLIKHHWKCFWYLIFIPDYSNQKDKDEKH